ncbi:MAG: ATP-grasp domain-containing protein, partial [Casimicrobiaceae bacterium]
FVNEIAPRPHNSGHYTIEACVTSQFEQQVRVLAGLPLGDPSLIRPAVMVNLLGDIWFDAPTPMQPDWASVLALPGAHLHLYGKAEPRRGRKMGHITCTAETLEDALAVAGEVERVLRIVGR